jgi:hypothetical protein
MVAYLLILLLVGTATSCLTCAMCRQVIRRRNVPKRLHAEFIAMLVGACIGTILISVLWPAWHNLPNKWRNTQEYSTEGPPPAVWILAVASVTLAALFPAHSAARFYERLAERSANIEVTNEQLVGCAESTHLVRLWWSQNQDSALMAGLLWLLAFGVWLSANPSDMSKAATSFLAGLGVLPALASWGFIAAVILESLLNPMQRLYSRSLSS